jgi:hypothetical protein
MEVVANFFKQSELRTRYKYRFIPAQNSINHTYTRMIVEFN